MKVYEWIISLVLIGIGIMSLAVCGTFYKLTQAGFWLALFKTLLEVSFWIGIPILFIFLLSYIYWKHKK